MNKNNLHNEGNALRDKIAAGEEAAFDQLFLDMYPPLFILTSRLIHDESFAKDIVSESFLHLWENRTSLMHVTDLKAFLYTSTRNRALDFLKKRERSLRREERAQQQESLASPAENILNAILDAEALRTLYAAIQSLPPECRKVVQLGMDGYSTSEIADQLSISPSAVSHQKARAIRLLKDKITVSLLLSLLM